MTCVGSGGLLEVACHPEDDEDSDGYDVDGGKRNPLDGRWTAAPPRQRFCLHLTCP